MTAVAQANSADAKALQELPKYILVRDSVKALYDRMLERTNAMRSVGQEPSGDLVRSQQALYDAWMPLNREINALTAKIIPAIRMAAQQGRITPGDLQTLANARIIPSVNGAPTIPGGWGLRGLGILPIIGWALAVAIVTYIGAMALANAVERIKIASAKANVIYAESEKLLAAQEAQWTAQVESQKAAAAAQIKVATKAAEEAIKRGEPIPQGLFEVQKIYNQLNTAPLVSGIKADQGEDAGSTLSNLGKWAIVGAVGVGLLYAWGQRRSQ